ncbi:MAG: hypothetical protein QOE77_3381 [Blastocatellia bacterium]|jgi:hypothetical protein|nr:hypothetical protein [Blastocatellia bacterium]
MEDLVIGDETGRPTRYRVVVLTSSGLADERGVRSEGPALVVAALRASPIFVGALTPT